MRAQQLLICNEMSAPAEKMPTSPSKSLVAASKVVDPILDLTTTCPSSPVTRFCSNGTSDYRYELWSTSLSL